MQSEETEFPSLAEERKLKTKCFFLKSRKEAASVEFLNGDGSKWRGTPHSIGSQAWWGWEQVSLSHQPVKELTSWNPGCQDVPLSGERAGAWLFCL